MRVRTLIRERAQLNRTLTLEFMTIALKLELPIDIRVDVGKKIKKLRSETSLSQQALAVRCGIFRTYLSRIENGTANPSITVVAALAAALGVEVVELFSG
jgi:DNA-binding XRE family transcriptional regulator